jgi:aspartyl-tRNA(Asn)/glutamyl-tRNA(Gln) amidotransferase subunit A
LTHLGAAVEEQTVNQLDEAATVLWTIIMGDAAVVHEAHLQSHADALDPEVRQIAQQGQDVRAVDYLKAQQAREKITAQLLQALSQVDVLVTPTAPIVAPQLQETTVQIDGKQVPMRPALRRFTLPFNLTGFPACTVPCGFSPEGLPIGLQIIGKPFAEAEVLRVAHAYEHSTDWHRRHPA